MGRGKSAAALVAGIEAFPLKEIFEIRKRGDRVPNHRGKTRFTQCRAHRHRHFQTATDHPSVTCAGALTDAARIQHGYCQAMANELQPRSQAAIAATHRSEEHTSELPSLMRNSYDVFCLKRKTPHN